MTKRYSELAGGTTGTMESEEQSCCDVGAYIITGGLGALGLQAAKVLTQLGARNIILLSRSGRVSYEGQGLEEDLQWLEEQQGVRVQTMRCDVSDEASLERCLLEVRAS